jgi:1,4-dihydroxy-2-naphthoyl-CoA synthase
LVSSRLVSSGTYRINTDIVQFNRPQFLNSFGGNLLAESIQAIRELNEHPDTVFTVLTGEGRFFCSGADVRSTFTLSWNTAVGMISILHYLRLGTIRNRGKWHCCPEEVGIPESIY